MKKSGWMKTVLWVIAISAWVFLIVVGVQFLLGLMVARILPSEVLDSPVTTAIFSVISYALALVIIMLLPPIIFKKKFTKPSRKSLGLFGLPTWTDIGLAPVGYVVSVLLATGLTALFKFLPWFDASEAQDVGYSLYMVGFERGLAFVILAIIAPIAEELIFRGWLYGKLRIKIPKWVAILITSFLFGLIHLQWNVGVTVFCMSVVMCILREITGTIYAGMLVHMLSNGIAFFLVYVVGGF